MGGDTLERDRELSRLTSALADAAGGAGSLVVIEGPPGIGKTRLIAEVREQAKRDGFGRIHAVGDEPERSVPWGVVRQLVDRSVLRYAGATREAILAGPAGAALAAIERAPVDDDAADAELARTLHALWWVAADLAADRPLLITVDDAQWADVPSLRFVSYLARRIADLPIALVVGTRPPGADGGPLSELTAGRGGERLLPQPLSPAALAVLVAERAGAQPAAEVVAALHAASGGNPFLAGQLLGELELAGRALTDAASAQEVRELGPRTVSRALLARLSPEARDLAGAAAVLGARAAPAAAAELAGLSEAAGAAAADELRRAHVVEADGVELAYVHPVVREAVLGELAPARRAALHAAVARRLHRAGAPAERVAAHLAEAPDGTIDGAPALLHEAARVLLADGDATTAAAYLQRAHAEAPGDGEIAAALGQALLRAGRPGAARDVLRDAVRDAGDPVERARRVARAAEATLAVDGPEAAVGELRAALDDPQTADETAQLILEARLAEVATYLPGERERSGRRLARFGDRPGDTPEERTLLALLAQWRFGAAQDAPGVVALVERAVCDGRLLRAAQGVLPWGQALHAAAFADGVDVVADEIAHARATLLPRGGPVDFATVATIEQFHAWRVGDVPRCEAAAAGALEALELVDPTPFTVALRAVGTRFAVHAAVERGDRDGARAILDAWDAGPTAHAPAIVAARIGLARAALALALDDPALALREARAAGDAEAGVGDNPALAWRVTAALAARRLDDDGLARDLATEQLALARRWGAASDVGAALRLRARVDPGDDLVASLEEAVAVLEEAPARLELAAALCDLGEALRVERRRREAHAPLERAAELAERCGATVLRTRALAGLAALGDRPRRLAFSGADALTASERRVAELASAGRSNREIAQELFVTPKTVENHLGRVYTKLGIGGRRELGAALSDGAAVTT